MRLLHKAKSIFKAVKNSIKNIFNFSSRSKKDEKPKAIAFVDYEYWYYSYKNFFGMKPNIVEWRRHLDEKYRLNDVMVFANFDNKEIRKELVNIRKITNSIIETQQIISNFSKEMTDFIMLDYIYQYVNEAQDTDTFILFTGDAHFQSVVKYLMQKCNKKVIIYAVKNSCSSMLKQIASETIEYPASDEVIQALYPIIVENMAYVSSRFDVVPTFMATSRTISSQYDVPEEMVRIALNDMKHKGLLYSRKQRVDFNKFVDVLAANWEALVEAGLWSY